MLLGFGCARLPVASSPHAMDLAMRVVWLAVLLSSLPALAMQRGSGYGKGSQGGKPRYWGTGRGNGYWIWFFV